MISVGIRPGLPCMVAYSTPGVSGATKSPRPVEFVVTWSPFENAIVTPGVNLPFISSAASVVRSPAIIFRGTNRIRAFFAAGTCCPTVLPDHETANANSATCINREFMTAIVGENGTAR